MGVLSSVQLVPLILTVNMVELGHCFPQRLNDGALEASHGIEDVSMTTHVTVCVLPDACLSAFLCTLVVAMPNPACVFRQPACDSRRATVT